MNLKYLILIETNTLSYIINKIISQITNLRQQYLVEYFFSKKISTKNCY